jgi:hypothetical protein
LCVRGVVAEATDTSVELAEEATADLSPPLVEYAGLAQWDAGETVKAHEPAAPMKTVETSDLD